MFLRTKAQQDELFTEVGLLLGYNTLYRRRQDQVYYCPHRSTSLCAHQYKLLSLKNATMWSVLESPSSWRILMFLRIKAQQDESLYDRTEVG